MTIPNTKPTFVVLVIDKASERDEAAEILMQDGYRVIAVPTAEQAVAVIHARWETQLVVTDVQLPGPMDGYALARLLDIKWPGMGVVVVGTREPRPEDLPRGLTSFSGPTPGPRWSKRFVSFWESHWRFRAIASG
jgi:CheY-like chemotaxis protein